MKHTEKVRELYDRLTSDNDQFGYLAMLSECDDVDDAEKVLWNHLRYVVFNDDTSSFIDEVLEFSKISDDHTHLLTILLEEVRSEELLKKVLHSSFNIDDLFEDDSIDLHKVHTLVENCR